MDFQYIELAREVIVDTLLENLPRLSPREAEELALKIVLALEEYLEEAMK